MLRGFILIFIFMIHFAFAANDSLELISPDKFGSAVERLRPQGFPDSEARVVAIGYNHVTHTVIVTTFDATGEPKKWSTPMDYEAYKKLAEPEPITVESTPTMRLRQDGRVYFMIQTMIKSFYVYPYGLSVAFPGMERQVGGGLTLLFGGGSLYTSYLFTKNRELGYGRVSMLNYGGELGTAYPLLLELALASGTKMDERKKDSLGYEIYNQDPYLSEKIGAWGRMIGFPLGIYAGSKVNFCGNDQYGNASIMINFSRWGWMYGWMIPAYGSGNNFDAYIATSSILTMALLPTGFYLGYRVTRGENYSSGRSFLTLTTGVMGTLTGILIPTLGDSKEKNSYLTGALIGQMAGTFFGFQFNKKEAYSFGQGVFMALSAAGGSAVALSIPLISQSNTHQYFTLMGIGGGWSGLVLGERLAKSIFDTSEKDRRAAAHVAFPIFWEWPMLVAGQKLRAACSGQSKPVAVDFIRATF